MPYQMSEEEQEQEAKKWKDLEENFQKQVEEYKIQKEKELREGLTEELEEELENKKQYISLYDEGGVSDILLNVQFIRAKIKVLQDLLNKQ